MVKNSTSQTRSFPFCIQISLQMLTTFSEICFIKDLFLKKKLKSVHISYFFRIWLLHNEEACRLHK